MRQFEGAHRQMNNPGELQLSRRVDWMLVNPVYALQAKAVMSLLANFMLSTEQDSPSHSPPPLRALNHNIEQDARRRLTYIFHPMGTPAPHQRFSIPRILGRAERAIGPAGTDAARHTLHTIQQ